MPKIINDNFFDSLFSAFQEDDKTALDKALEADRVRSIRLMYHTIVRSAFEEFLELATDDFVMEIFGPESSPFSGRWQGRQEVLGAMQRNFSMVREQNPLIETVVAQGDVVIVIARETGVMNESHSRYEVRWVQEFLFHGSKVKQFRQIIGDSSCYGD